MPTLEVDSHHVPAVADVALLLDDLLRHATRVKSSATIEPPLDKSDFDHLSTRLSTIFANRKAAVDHGEQNKLHQFAIIETAVRDMFSQFIATIPIDSPDFVKVWNLLDIISLLSDSEQCDPALLFWLVEELLDSQTIAGCRKIFDFLESRRERITAKHFKQKQLIILRSCNELLRRLSRAEDTAFCGRVFIFMFQSFPLGDKSSVNLRGEYHVENVTTYDQTPKAASDTEKMEVDTQPGGSKENSEAKTATKAVSFDGEKQAVQAEKPLDPDALYPVFWSLQESFNQPKKLFDPAHFTHFKTGLEATMLAFREIKVDQGGRSAKSLDDGKRNLKRKRTEGDEEGSVATAFNPKYLTSRDLFELEISDLSFRRHILVQALIIMDFILSLSPKAKEKLATVPAQNRSVAYADQTLSEDDTKWALDMKKTIADYLKQGAEGPFFYRMVETVLTRDKNWVRWKIENCPSIEKPPVSAETFNDAKKSVARVTTNKRLRPVPMNSMPLDFLDDSEEATSWDKYKNPDRYKLPDLQTFRKRIADEDFEIQMPANNASKQAAIERKASNAWRALRIAKGFKLAAFDKIDDPENIDVIFQEDSTEPKAQPDESGEGAAPPTDLRPIIVVGPTGAGKSTLVNMLLERRAGAFSKITPHTTQVKNNEETNGEDYRFVDKATFNMMVDGDQFLEFRETADASYGTNRRLADAVQDAGKVPVMQMPCSSVDMVKDNGYSARFVFVEPPSLAELESRLKSDGVSEDKLQEVLQAAAGEMETAKAGDVYDAMIANDDIETAYKCLEAFIYNTSESNPHMANGEAPAENADAAMKDTEPATAETENEPEQNGVDSSAAT